MKESQDDDQWVPINAARLPTSYHKGGLHQIVEDAAAVARTTMAAVSIRGRDHYGLVAKFGLESHEALRLESSCSRVVRQPGEPLVILDARRDEQFAALPMVLSAPFVRFYIGIPLVDRTGYALGAFYVVDNTARHEIPDLTALKRLAREAERLIARQ